jgi:RNA polymerase sigma-70 factor (ECF subfamily)
MTSGGRNRGRTSPARCSSRCSRGSAPSRAAPPALRTLVFSVAHARLVDDLRSRSRRAPSEEYDAHRDQRSSPSSEDEGLALLSNDRVRALLEGLPDDQRNVLLLRLVNDLSLEQTAQAIGHSTGAVKQLQRRALLTLRVRAEEGSVTR